MIVILGKLRTIIAVTSIGVIGLSMLCVCAVMAISPDGELIGIPFTFSLAPAIRLAFIGLFGLLVSTFMDIAVHLIKGDL